MYSIGKIMCFFNIKACQHILSHQIHKIITFKKASYDPFKSIVLNLNIFFYVIYSCDAKLNFQHHYSSLQCHMTVEEIILIC